MTEPRKQKNTPCKAEYCRAVEHKEVGERTRDMSQSSCDMSQSSEKKKSCYERLWILHHSGLKKQINAKLLFGVVEVYKKYLIF